MADENEDLVVTLGDPPETETKPEVAVEAKPPPVPGPSAAPVPAPASVTPENGLKDLEQQVAGERRERERLAEIARRLTSERDRAMQQAREAEQRGGTNYEAYVDSQIQGQTAEMDALAQQAEAALSDGDFKTVAEINKRLGRIGGSLAVNEREKLALQQQREARERQPQQRPAQQPPQQQRPTPTTAMEKALEGRTEPAKAFLRKHPDLVRSDGTLTRPVLNAHYKALGAGFDADTEQYFEHIEGLLAANGAQPNNGVPAAPAAQVPGYAAPVARGPAVGGDNLAPGTFRMTPKMRRLAEEQGVSPQEWANNYVRLVKEGRMTPIT